MKMSRFVRCLAVLVVLAGCAGLSVAHADAFLKQIRHTEAAQMMGQEVPAKTETTLLWFSEKAARMDTGDGNTVILRADESIVYMFDHNDKTYVEIPLDQAGLIKALTPEGGTEEDAQAAEMMKQMVANMMSNTQVTVTPTEERKKIREWNARKYMVEIKMPMGTATSEVWASPDVKINAGLFQKLNMAMSGMMTDVEKMTKEMQKIEGMEVYSSTVVNMMGNEAKSTSELIEYGEQTPPGNGYALPEGYKKTKLGQ